MAYPETEQGSLLDPVPGSGAAQEAGEEETSFQHTTPSVGEDGNLPTESNACFLALDERWLVLELHVRAVMVNSPSIPDDTEEASAGGTARPAVGVTVGSKNCSRSCYIRASTSKV